MNMSMRTTVLLLLVLVAGGVLGYVLRGAGVDADGTSSGWDDVNQWVCPISVILFPIDPQHGALRARESAQRIHAELMGGADFAAVARRASRAPSAPNGGYLGFLGQGGKTPLEGAAQALRPGEISFPILTKEGYQIVKRHTFAEARAMEQATSIPAHGVFVKWEGLSGGRAGVTREDARKEAEQIASDLASGKMTLDDAAERYTEPDRRRPRAFIALVTNSGASAKAYQALSKVPAGGVVGPIAEPHGWGVLVRGRHFRALLRQILIQFAGARTRDIRVGRTRAEALELAKRVLAEVRSDPGVWQSAVERFSDDKGSISSGGSLGVVHAGELPAGFEEVIHDVPPGSIHDGVIESPQGFHIVWRVN